MDRTRQQGSDVQKMANAIHMLNTAPSGLVLTAEDHDILGAALLAYNHEWKDDHWETPFGPVRTMAELRVVRDKVTRGEVPKAD